MVLHTLVATCQNQPNHISFYDATILEVIKQLEEAAGIKFNFIEENLPIEKLTFSIDIDREMMNVLSDVINRKIIELEENLYGITQKDRHSSPVIPTLSGIVLDEFNGPMVGCNIWIPALKRGTASKQDGRFDIPGHIAQNETIEISFLGYQEVEISYADLAQNEFTIRLVEKAQHLGDIIITDSKAVSSGTSTQLLGKESIDNSVQVDKDILRTAQIVPGVYSASESISDIQIRGGSPDHVGFQWNNIQLYQPSLFYGRISSVNPFMTNEIIVNKSQSDAAESGMLSGTIKMNSQPESIQKTSLDIQQNLIFSNIGLKTQLLGGKLKIQSAYRRSITGFWKSPLYDQYFNNIFQRGRLDDIEYYTAFYETEEFVDINTDFSFYDFSTSATLNIDPVTRLKIDYLDIGNRFTMILEDIWKDFDEEDNLNISTRGYNVDLSRYFGSKFKTSINFSQTDYNYVYKFLEDNMDENAGSRDSDNQVNYNKWTWGNELHYRYAQFNFGFQYQSWSAKFIDRTSVSTDYQFFVDFLGETDETAWFGSGRFYVSNYIDLSLAARWSNYSDALNNEKFFEPRVHLAVKPTSNLNFFATYGENHQPLTRRAFETTLQAENGIWYLADESPDAREFVYIVRGKQSEIGMNIRYPSWWFSMSAYDKYINNAWTASLDFIVEEDPFEFTDISVRGIEVGIGYVLGSGAISLTYDYIDEKLATEFSKTQVPSPLTQPHRLGIYGQYSTGSFLFTSEFKAATGRLFSTPLELVIGENEEGEVFYDVVYDGLLSQRIEPYVSLDLGVKYSYYYGKKGSRKIQLGLQLLNVLNRNNILKNQIGINYRLDPVELSLLRRRGIPRSLNVDVLFSF